MHTGFLTECFVPSIFQLHYFSLCFIFLHTKPVGTAIFNLLILPWTVINITKIIQMKKQNVKYMVISITWLMHIRLCNVYVWCKNPICTNIIVLLHDAGSWALMYTRIEGQLGTYILAYVACKLPLSLWHRSTTV